MKLRALGNLSGAVGEKAKGDEFTADATVGKSLIERGLAVQVDGPTVAAAPEKGAKTKE
jgi:hypothetical protein